MTPRRAIAITLSLFVSLSCGGGEGGQGSRTLIQNKGSDTLVNVAQAWAEAYGETHPGVMVAVSGGGSGTGFSAMINGTVDIANASREIRESEIEAVENARGLTPVEFVVGYDALSIFLHPDNPIDSISIATLAEIYGEGGRFESWSDLGITVPGCPSGEIIRVSRQNNSGTYAYFREAILGEDGEYKLGSRDMNGSSEVVHLVEQTPCAIGYSGMAYATPSVKEPCLVVEEGGACIRPTLEAAVTGEYPIARPLLMYTAGEPEGPLKEYMDWILSEAGQCILADAGYAPLRSDLTCPPTGGM